MSSGLHSVYLKFKEALLNFPEKQMNGRQAPPTLPSVDCVCADIFCYYKIHFEKKSTFRGCSLQIAPRDHVAHPCVRSSVP